MILLSAGNSYGPGIIIAVTILPALLQWLIIKSAVKRGVKEALKENQIENLHGSE